jgi:P4 family phage/plasmid primase-like protien
MEDSESAKAKRKEAEQFLQTLFNKSHDYIEIRAISPSEKRVRQSFTRSIDNAVHQAMDLASGTNVYIGVATRKRHGGKKQDTSEFVSVYVDLDFKDLAGGEEEAKERLNALPLKPTMVVHSGGGYHLYWALHEPRAIAPETIPFFESLNKRFAAMLGGDSCHSIDHILRMPGTINWPDEKKQRLGRTPIPVRLISADGPRYNLEDLDDGSFEPAFSKQSAQGQRQVNSEPPIAPASLPPRFTELLTRHTLFQDIWLGRLGHLVDHSRSGYDMVMSYHVTRLGFSDREIRSILRFMPSGRGEEATDGYLKRTIKKARLASGKGIQTAPDLADQFLIARQYYDDDGSRLRWYRQNWYTFDGKIYKIKPEYSLEAEVLEYVQLGEGRRQATKSYRDNVIRNLQSRCHVDSSVELPALENNSKWSTLPDHIVVTNGILSIDAVFNDVLDEALWLHEPGFFSTVALSFAFDVNADCPKWRSFLEQILPDSASRLLLQEIFGYCLTFDVAQQKFFIFEGPGGNGKGVVLNTLTALLGEANVSSLGLEVFSHTHGLELTLGKLVNITGDVGELDKVAEGTLKLFTGCDMLHFNPKYKNPFSARATARIIIATNVRPPFRDRSDGIWRRLVLLPFPVTIPEEQQNKKLADELKAELAGILNWSIDGAKRLREQRVFTEPSASREAKQEYQLESNPARSFLHESYTFDSNSTIETTTLYYAYQHFCEMNGYKPLNEANLGKEVRRCFPEVKRTKLPKDKDNYRPWAYKGLGLIK